MKAALPMTPMRPGSNPFSRSTRATVQSETRIRSFFISPTILPYPQPVALPISMINCRISAGFRGRPRLHRRLPDLLSLTQRG